MLVEKDCDSVGHWWLIWFHEFGLIVLCMHNVGRKRVMAALAVQLLV
jgi:hypothetical protein